jgi:hypothetical protein
MPGDNRDSMTEARIDAALRSYAEPPAMASDPRTAAAAILERVRQAQRRRRLWWLWAIPTGVAMGVAVVVLFLSLHTPHGPLSVDVAQVPHAAQPLPAPHAMEPARLHAATPAKRRVMHRLRPQAAPLPEQAVFPAPAPLSRQERALLVFARTAPPAVRQAVINEQSRWAEEAHMVSSSPIHPISESDQDRP